MILDYSAFEPKLENEIFDNHVTPLYNQIITGFFEGVTEKCKFCDSKLDIPFKDISKGNVGFDYAKIVYDCSNCGWWYFTDKESLYLGEGYTQISAHKLYGILKRYPVNSLNIPINTLRKELLKRPEIAYDIHPTKFEKLIGSILKDYYDCEVIHVGKSNDGGIDLILIRSDYEAVIQVKRRKSPNSTEGVAVIRDLILQLQF